MKIILFRGRPGTGKTTLTHAFAERTHFAVLRKDDIYDPVSEYIKEHSDRNKASHGILYKILESNIHSGTTFILDFAFQNSNDYSIIKDWCAERNIEFKSVLVTCSDEKLWAERLERRAENPTPNQLITSFEGFKKHYGTMHLEAEVGELVVDTVKLVEEIIPEVLEYV